MSSSFEDGEVVWVKWGNCWWPGEVWSDLRVPGDLKNSLRKPVIAFVKFFQEDSFEFVRNLNNIMKYDCDMKMEYIKKGMDKYRASKKMMTNFPADVTKAEQLTGGNVNILSNLETTTKHKVNSTSVTVESPPVLSKKSAGMYNSSTKVQFTSSLSPKSDKKFTCTMCNFATDRMNLLMFHIKNHSTSVTPRVKDPTPFEVKKLSSRSPSKRTNDDSIADDVRKIKESMKKEKELKPSAKKVRESKLELRTPKNSRALKKDEKVKDQERKSVEEKLKQVNELKNELLADWMDDDEIVEPKETAEVHQSIPSTIETLEKPTVASFGETSRSIRNIPKKSYNKQEPAKVEQWLESSPKTNNKVEEIIISSPPSIDASSKSPSKTNSVAEPKKISEKADESLLMATSELLNETDVPNLTSTFHRINDIDKRNLPPKERNKRDFRANTSLESSSNPSQSSNNGTNKEQPKLIQNELMLPHKKKQSSRVMVADKTPVVRASEVRSPRNKRKSSSDAKTSNLDSNTYEEEPIRMTQSPLREVAEVTNSISSPRSGLKRRNSKSSLDEGPEPKKSLKSESDLQQRKIVACASEACITSKGEISVSRRDSLITTQANSVTVTSQVIITEATHHPIVSSAPSIETLSSSKQTAIIKIPSSQSLKNALKVPTEKLIEMKKQGLVKVGIDMKNKLTEKGKQIFKGIQGKEKTVEIFPEDKNALQPLSVLEEERAKSPEIISSEAKDEASKLAVEYELKTVSVDEPQGSESNGSIPPKQIEEESTNNNEVEKESSDIAEPNESVVETNENGKEPEVEIEDPNNGGAGLIALQAETFGGPPNCFYLCRQVDDRYEPVDNQILVLNAQNALVPLDEGDIVEDSLTSSEVVSENLAFPQLSPNSNIIINTPNGQKIELTHYAILALQEQADENGNASIELSGEQLELNINMILEAINAQQEQSDVMLIDGEGALMIDPELPLEIHHTATQVSETLSKPIMSTTEIPSAKMTISETVSKNLNIEDSLATIGVTQRSNVPKSLELPITVTNPAIAETVNNRKMVNAPIVLGDVTSIVSVPESFVTQSGDNGSEF